jgi:RHS repeat-associated protein
VAAEDPNLLNPYMFTGRRFDFETGLYYYRARYYNPYIGRFLQTDPVGYGYNYCGNNPVGWTDPLGLEEEPATAYLVFVPDPSFGTVTEYWELTGEWNCLGFVKVFRTPLESISAIRLSGPGIDPGLPAWLVTWAPITEWFDTTGYSIGGMRPLDGEGLSYTLIPDVEPEPSEPIIWTPPDWIRPPIGIIGDPHGIVGGGEAIIRGGTTAWTYRRVIERGADDGLDFIGSPVYERMRRIPKEIEGPYKPRPRHPRPRRYRR